MGITATNEALERIREVEPVIYNILKRSWEEAFGDRVPEAIIKGRLLQEEISNSENKDIQFVVKSINQVISSQ